MSPSLDRELNESKFVFAHPCIRVAWYRVGSQYVLVDPSVGHYKGMSGVEQEDHRNTSSTLDDRKSSLCSWVGANCEQS